MGNPFGMEDSFIGIGFRLTLLLFDLISFIVLSKLLKNKTKEIIFFYWLSPLIFFVTYIYGQLDLGATELTRGYGWVWSVSGWLLTPFMKRAGPEVVARMQQRVLDEIDTTFVSHYSSRISLAEAITVEAVKDYGARKTGQKTLLRMAESSS